MSCFERSLGTTGESRHFKEFLIGQGGGNAGQRSGNRNDRTLPPPLGIIEVIHAASIGVSMSRWKGILNVATSFEAEVVNRPEKTLRVSRDPITFNEANLEGTSQLHDDVLVVTSRIRGFLVKRVMISCILTCIRGWG